MFLETTGLEKQQPSFSLGGEEGGGAKDLNEMKTRADERYSSFSCTRHR